MDERDGWIELFIGWFTWVLLLMAFAGITALGITAGAGGSGDTGRHVGPAVVEQYDTSWVTSDPTADYLIDVGEPLPPAAPGADQ